MSQEIFEIVKQMNLDNLEVQIALQCAPLISGFVEDSVQRQRKVDNASV